MAVTGGYTLYNASQMYKHRPRQKLENVLKEDTVSHVKQSFPREWQKSKQEHQDGNTYILKDQQKDRDEQISMKKDEVLLKTENGNKGLEYKDHEPVEKLKQDTGNVTE